MASRKAPIRVSNKKRNILYPPIRQQIMRSQRRTRSTGGDRPEQINLRQFEADLPSKLKQTLTKLLQTGQIQEAYPLACDYVLQYFANDQRTYDFKKYDHGRWVELLLDLAN